MLNCLHFLNYALRKMNVHLLVPFCHHLFQFQPWESFTVSQVHGYSHVSMFKTDDSCFHTQTVMVPCANKIYFPSNITDVSFIFHFSSHLKTKHRFSEND